MNLKENESLDRQLEAYDAYNLLLDKRAGIEESELKIMKEYGVLNKEGEEKEEEALEGNSGEKNPKRKSKNLRIRTNKNKTKEKKLYVDSNEYKRFLDEKKKSAGGLFSSDFAENL